MSDFKLSGVLEIQGIMGLDRAVNTMRHQLESLKVDTKLGDSQQYVQGMQKAAAATRQTRTEIVSATTNLQSFGDQAAIALRRFTAFSLAAGATFGAARLIFGGLKDAANFQRELIKVSQVSGSTANTIADLRNEITRLGHSLAAPADELNNVAKTLSQAGFKIGEVKTLLEALAQTRLAATFGTIAQTTEGVIALSGQFKLKVGDMSDALGIINEVAAKYAVESDDLISAIRRTGGVFVAASGDISQGTKALSEFSALFTSVRQTTRQASETISTGLRTVFARLERPKTVKYFKDLGVDLTDNEGKFVGVYQAIQKIGQALDGLDTRSLKFAEIVDVIGGARQLGVVVPLIKEWRLQQEILNTAMAGTNSLLRDAAAPLDTIKERFNALSNDWSAFSRDVFNSNTFQFLAKEAISLASALVRVADSLSGILPIFAALGALKLGATIASEGVIGAITSRLTTGHSLAGRATGGYIPGHGSGDTVPIMAEPGEFVLRKKAANALGITTLNRLNHAERFASGGMIGRKMMGYAGGGDIKNSVDFNSGAEFNDIRKEFRNLGKSIGLSDDAFNKLATEIRSLATDADSARKLFKGGIQAANYNTSGADLRGGGTTAGGFSRAYRSTYSNRTSFNLIGPVVDPNKKSQLLLEDKSTELEPPINLPSGPVSRGVARNVNRNLDTQVLNPLQQIRRPGANRLAFSNPSSYQELSIFQNKKLAAGFSIKGSTTNLANQGFSLDTARDIRVASLLSGPESVNLLTQNELSGLGGSLQTESAGYTRLKNRPPEFNAYDNYAASFNSPSAKLDRLRASNTVGAKLSRFGGRVSGGINALGNASRNIGSNPLGLTLLAAGTEYAGDKLGVDKRITGTLSGALGGAAAGSFLGGAPGAVIGGAVGAATGFIGASEQKERAVVEKELTENTKKLDKAFSDLSEGGAKKLDELLNKRSNLTNQLQDIGSRGFGERIGAAIGGTRGGKGLGIGDGALGGLGIGVGSVGAIAGAGILPAAGAAAGIYFGGKAIGDAFGRDGGLLKGAPKQGETIGGDLAYNAILSEPREKAAAQAAAEQNSPQAEAARNRIKELVSRGRHTEVTNQLLQASFSDSPEKLQALANARKFNKTGVDPDTGKTYSTVGSVTNSLVAEARSNLVKQTDVDKGDRLNLALKNIDLFASKLDKAQNLLGLFGANLQQSQSAIDNAFNQAQGTFTSNRSFQNPFDNVKALNTNQIRDATGNLESFLGTKISSQAKGILEATPTLQDLPKIINEERDKVLKGGGVIDDKFVENLIHGKGGRLSGLPDQVKQNLGSVFENLKPEDLQAYLSGNKENRNSNEITDKVNIITDKTGEVFKKLQDAANDLAKTFLVNAANQRAALLTSATGLASERQGQIGNSILTLDRLRGTDKIDARGAAQLELNPIRALTGGLDNPLDIGNRIRGLQGQLTSANNGINPDTGGKFKDIAEQSRYIGGLNSELATTTQGLKKLGDSAVGLAAIENKLGEVRQKQATLSGSVLDDALGGNQQAIARGQAALKIFDKGGARGLRNLRALGGSSEDLKLGIEREHQRLLNQGTPEEAQKFLTEESRKVNQQGAGILIDPKRAAQNEEAFGKNDKKEKDLLGQAKDAFNAQTLAIQEQQRLLADNIQNFDATLTNKLLIGVRELAAVAQQLHIPEKISMKVQHDFGPLNITGLDLAHLTPAMQKIAQDAVSIALSKLSDGREKSGTRIPGAAQQGLDDAFAGR